MELTSDQYEPTGLEIAVIGMSGRFPGAPNLEIFWENLRNGKETITFFTDEELVQAGVEPVLIKNPNYVKAKPELKDKEYFDNYFFGYTPAEAEVMAPQVRIYHECAWAALENAGYDPYAYQGLIGCYAGSSSDFTWQAFTHTTGINKRLGLWESHLMSNKDNLGTHLAYKLNLKGPVLTFFTACSTSLAAVHLACRALLTGECSMALAGGISLDILSKPGYLYQEGMILSPDGHCRTFDAAANGTIFGEGVGVVVLKRLREAIKDGDHIYAAVKGSSVNNDGIERVGYTAPGTHGQCNVVKLALKAAKVPAESISYVETHGTGTPLGDPVEIAALIEAFHTDKKQFCALGSVKTNIGHLDTAAGIAGFIKTVLALKHHLIPPHLHFQNPNPQIDFDHSPFYINTQPREWQNKTGLLRAGVNSFGLGGTNAHVILEEIAPGGKGALFEKTAPFTPTKTFYLFLLSAKTTTALDKMSENIALYLMKNPSLNLADLAYTLQVGRHAFQHRRMVVGSSTAEIIRELNRHGNPNTFSAPGENLKPPVIFMFPGVGSQYVNMGLDLYKNIHVFREEMERCFAILQFITGCNFKEILYPSFANNSSNMSYQANIIDQPGIAQPLVFIFQYALVKLLASWGIKPQAMIGYSLGEYAAACAAGVFSLEDGLQLVVSRGKLIEKTLPGAMLSVPLPHQEVFPLLAEGNRGQAKISVAIDNGPSCIVAGSPEDIEALATKLKDKKIICLPVPGSGRALHTPMMGSITREYREILSSLHLNVPQIPYISNVTGNWIRAQQAIDPNYWTDHLQKTVQFAGGIQLLINKWPGGVFIEIGPGSDLSALTTRYSNENSQGQMIPLVRRPQRKVADDFFLLDKIGRLWLYDIKPDWHAFYAGEKRQRIPLPSYPFDRYCFPVQGDPFAREMEMNISPQSSSSLPGQLEKKPDLADWFYLPSWKRTMLPSLNILSQPVSLSLCWLILGNPANLGTRLAERLTNANSNQDVMIVDRNKMNPGSPISYNELFAELKRQGKIPRKIIHLWGLDQENKQYGEEDKIETFDAAQESGLYSLVHLSRAIHNLECAGNFEIIVISSGLHEVTGTEILYPEKSTILAAIKTIPQEYTYITCRNIDITIPIPGQAKIYEKLIDRLVIEISMPTGSSDIITAYRDDYRWSQVYEPIRLEQVPIGVNIPRLKQKGVYLVTGGPGGMGLSLANYLARDIQARLILVGRSYLPPRQQWEQWLHDHKEDDDTNTKILKIKELEKAGAEVLVFSADVSNYREMVRVITIAEEQFGPLNGVIHAAGILGKGAASFNIISKLDDTLFKEQFQAKVYGLLTLSGILADKPLDFFICTSSLSPILGGLGFTAYSAANQFMDTFVYKHKRENSTDQAFWLSLNWGDWQPWQITTNQTNVIGAAINRLNMSPGEGIETFRRILFHCQSHQIVVSSGDLQVRINQWVKLKSLHEQTQPTKDAIYRRSHLTDTYVAPGDHLENTLAEIWQGLFGFERIGIHDDFFELGGDSLKAITLAARIHKALNIEIPLTEFFESPTIAKQAHFIHQNTVVETGSYEIIETVEKKEYYALSPAQKRLFILQQMQKEFTGYNDQLAFIFEGELEKEKIFQTFTKLLARHESLRTSFQVIAEEPVQRIHCLEKVPFEIEYYDLAVEAVVDTFIRPFDLTRAPLLRAGVIKETETRYMLLVDIHHIVADGTSLKILIKEFRSLYNGEDLSLLRVNYKDYAQWQNSTHRQEIFKGQEKYWLSIFADEVPVTVLPTDYKRPIIQEFAGNRIRFELSGADTCALKQMSTAHGTTLFMLLLAIFNILTAKLSNAEDIVIGVPTAGRRHVDLEQIVGMFVNTLALRNSPIGEKTFNDFLCEVKERTLGAFENQDYPFEELVEKVKVTRDVSRNPMFDVMFVLQNFGEPISNGPIKEWEYDFKLSKFDLTLSANEQGDRLFFYLEYRTQLFKDESILRFISYFKSLVSSTLAEPDQKITKLNILPDEEKQQLLVDFNNTESIYAQDKTIKQLFELQAIKTPDRIALVGAAPRGCPFPFIRYVHLTYQQLNEESSYGAHLLKKKGVLADNIIALRMEQSIDVIIIILAIWKAGGAYLPIDPAYPQTRIDYILKDSGARIITGTAEEQEKLERAEFNASNLAYIIYTSGTTGKPKGVMVEHRNLTAYLHAFCREFDFTERDISIQLASYTFDVFIEEVFPVLIRGGKLVIPDRSEMMNIDVLAGLILRQQINIIDCTPLLLNEFNKLEMFMTGVCRNNYLFISGGDELKKEYIFNLLEIGNVYNTYGPTESTICAAYYRYHNDTSIPIGKPIANYKIYILDRCQNLLPIGVIGEICISGPGVTRGYLNHPELTFEKYNRSYRSHRAYILYHTGDLGRWLPGGNIEFLGRIDHQVKIRGFRIELAEIESQLLKYHLVKEAIVIARESEAKEKYLCAYVVPKEKFELSRLKEFLTDNLPHYMVPSYFIQIDAIPLDPHGKLDRKNLPIKDVAIGEGYIPPANETEEKLVALWAEVLDIEKNAISRQGNFFELGGHSLKVMVLAAKIHKEFNIKISMIEIFRLATVSELAGYIEKKQVISEDRHRNIEPVEKKEYYLLSSAQRRLYFLQQMASKSNTTYNVSHVCRLEGEIDISRLDIVSRKLIQRHENLRTSFITVDEKPAQRIHDKVEFKIEIGERLGISDFIRPFDLSCAPLIRIGLIKETKSRHILAVDIHHMVTDGASMELLIEELMIFYGGRELPPLRIQYKDYVYWQNQSVRLKAIRDQENYWLEQFQGEIPILHLPLDFPRPGLQSFEGAAVSFHIPLPAAKALNQMAAKCGATLYMVLLAVTAIFFAKLSNEEDIIIGTPTMGRRHADLERIIGMFVNTLALRIFPVGEKQFTNFLAEIKARTLAAFENQDYQFEDLVERVFVNRDISRNPLFDVSFVLQNLKKPSGSIPGLNVTSYDINISQSKFDITFGCSEDNDGLFFTLEYCTELFNKETSERFIIYYQNIIHDIIKKPSQLIHEIEILNEQEKHQLLVEFNDRGVPYPNNKTITGLFLEQLEKTPDHIAVIGSNNIKVMRAASQQQITYDQLNEQASQLAGLLKEKDVRVDSIVGIMFERSLEMIIGILGILKTGGAYLPIDPFAPSERIEYMLRDSGAKLLAVANDQEGEKVGRWEGEKVLLESICHISNYFSYQYSAFDIPRVQHSNHLCYIIYTSGSTGKPKGVPITHSNLSPLLHWGFRHLGLGTKDRFLQNLSYYFDWSVWEFFTALTTGASLYMVPKDLLLDPVRCIGFMTRNNITVLNVTPTQFQYYLKAPGKPWTLKYLFIGAERMSCELFRQILDSVPKDCRFFNMYGPTEGTIISTFIEIEQDHVERFKHLAKVPIGKALANIDLFILDKYLNLSPVNVIGELYIVGDCVARGYLNNPELTAQKFGLQVIKNKSFSRGARGAVFSKIAPLVFRTGDLVRRLTDGNIEFMGRIDHQVKIRGFRVELGEIESELLKYRLVKEAVVIDIERKPGEKYLCAYIVEKEKFELFVLQEYLSKRLPGYMVPSHLIRIAAVPLTSNGKLDRKALPEPGREEMEKNFISPRSELEIKLAGLWAEILEIKENIIGIDSDFFQLGGHSIKATALAARINREFKVNVPLVQVFSTPTIRGLAKYLEAPGKENVVTDSQLVSLKKSSRANPGNLFLVHDGSGEVEGYIEFCRCLELDIDCWGIRAERHESYAPGNLRIETTAGNYIEKIKFLQPQGPYNIAGWSLGGTIAFEMAYQLETKGETVSFLSLIDSPAPGAIYFPKGKTKAQLHYFKAADEPDEAAEISPRTLDEYCHQPVFNYEIKGNHYSILKMPAAAQLAQLFQRIFSTR